MVVPNGIHTTEDSRILFVEHFLADVCWSPIIVKRFAIQIVVIITGLGHDVSQSVRNGNELIALLYHITRFSITVVPGTHDNVFTLHGCFPFGMSQSTPYTSLLAEALHVTDVTVGKLAELFHYLRVFVGVFVGTDVYSLATEYRFFTFQIFFEQVVHKFVGLRIKEIKVIHAVFLRADFR